MNNQIAIKKKKPRGQRTPHCPKCRLYQDNCICEFQPTLQSKACFWLLAHSAELCKPTNTGQLISDCIDTTRFFIWERTNPPKELLQLLQDERYQPFLIFPDDFTEDKSKVTDYNEELIGDKIPAFIILDATWGQARKMYRKSEYLKRLPHLPLKPEKNSTYMLRKSSHDQHLCTVEVGIELLSLIGDGEAAEGLQSYFDKFNLHYLAGRNGHSIKRLGLPKKLLSSRKP